MIQILALREGSTPGRKIEVWFDKQLRAASVESLFMDPHSILERIPPSERWNVYYTVADCLEEKGRKLDVQHHIPFDVDGLDDGLDDNQLSLIARVVCEAIGVPFEKCGVIFSGHGVQIIVGTTFPITDKDEFEKQRPLYKAVCDKIDLKLMAAKIKGKADRSVWSPARLMRFPMTENRKPDKVPIMGRMLQSEIVRTDFTLRSASGIPEVDAKGQVARTLMDALPTPDTKAIFDQERGCKFLQWCQTEPDKVTEPEWYAMMSVTARLDEGRKLTHQMSKSHPGYSSEETDIKISQALESSGPRTCKNINAISGGKCATCHWYNSRLVSPIMIEGPDHIKTAKTGFRNVHFDAATGITTRKAINFDDLIKTYYKDQPYVNVRGMAQTWGYVKNHFRSLSAHEMGEFAYSAVDPSPSSGQVVEFVSRLKYTHVVSEDFFSRGVVGMMNFQNGIYDIKNGTFHEHSMEFGFRSVLNCDYDKAAECPKFLEFLDSVTCRRPELVDILQEYLGYIFANEECKYQKGLLLIGDGANGKSTLMDVVRALAGESGSAAVSVKDMRNDQKRVSLEGKLVNIAEENSQDAFADVELIKNFISGGRIGVKKVFEQPYDYVNTTKLVMLCNRLPRSTDASHGLLRRLIIVPFDATFDDSKGNRNVNMKDELLKELPGIFNWIIEGYRRLEKQRRFSGSKEVDKQLADYRLSIDTVAAFMHDECEINTTYKEGFSRAELYEAYTKWCIAGGQRNPVSSITFFKEIETMISKKTPVDDLFYRPRLADGSRPRMVRYIKCEYQTAF